MKKLIVWLDDLRDPSNYGLQDALWLKNSSEFMDFINDNGKLYRRVSEWHFDNDLGEVFEGYHCLSLLEEKFVFGKPPVVDNVKIFVHTSNPSAARKFMLAADSFKKFGIDIKQNIY